MFFRNIYVPAELQEFVMRGIEGGQYSNFGELLQTALRALEREERSRAAQRSPAAGSSATQLSCNTAIEDAL
jgi:Arc/MetJ-type ribon-helix-helix transcriptional regulator